MFELLFGGIFLFVSIFIFIMLLYLNVVEIWSIAFLSIFFIIGAVAFGIGIYKVLRNAKTSLKGEECFASVVDYYPTNTYINGYPVIRFEFNVYIESTHMVETVTEKIGTNPDKYPVGSFVKVKYYNHDINVLGIVNEIDVPSYAREKIKVNIPTGEVIEVDGKRYQRIE